MGNNLFKIKQLTRNMAENYGIAVILLKCFSLWNKEGNIKDILC